MMEPIQVIGVQRDQVEGLWSKVAPLLGMAVVKTEGRSSLEVILKNLLEKDMQLFVGVREGVLIGAMVTEILTYQNGEKGLHVAFLGGSGMKEWIRFLAGVERWALEMGCSEICFEGRHGWQRITRDPVSLRPRYYERGRMYARRLHPDSRESVHG